jgi:hypothetical protein
MINKLEKDWDSNSSGDQASGIQILSVIRNPVLAHSLQQQS